MLEFKVHWMTAMTCVVALADILYLAWLWRHLAARTTPSEGEE